MQCRCGHMLKFFAWLVCLRRTRARRNCVDENENDASGNHLLSVNAIPCDDNITSSFFFVKILRNRSRLTGRMGRIFSKYENRKMEVPKLCIFSRRFRIWTSFLTEIAFCRSLALEDIPETPLKLIVYSSVINLLRVATYSGLIRSVFSFELVLNFSVKHFRQNMIGTLVC